MFTTKRDSEEHSTENELHSHVSGDKHAGIGFRYECAWRCMWLLDLRGTQDSLAIAEGEDAKVSKEGQTIYRQVKKKDGSQWTWSDESFQKFINRAYNRFKDHKNAALRHEFYTNAGISSTVLSAGSLKGCLNPKHDGIKCTAPERTEDFCKSIVLHPHKHQPEDMPSIVMNKIREKIDQSYPGCQAHAIVEKEVPIIADKLLMAEYNLWNKPSAVSWKDVDKEIGLDKIISELGTRSMADGALTTWGDFSEVMQDDEKTRALEALRSNKAIPRPSSESQAWNLIGDWIRGLTPTETLKSKELKDYLIVILAGGHGCGKTWTLMHLGNRIATEFRNISVCVAANTPPSITRAFSSLAISHPNPCVILIDELYEGWDGPVSSINYPLTQPILFLVTASLTEDGLGFKQLKEKLGQRRVKVIEVQTRLDEDEVKNLGLLRGVPIAIKEKDKVQATNIRHAVQIMSGERPDNHLASLEALLERETDLIDWLGPIMFCTTLRIPLPGSLLERSLTRAIPQKLKPWLVLRQKVRGNDREYWVLFEDPYEADILLTVPLLGGARENQIKAISARLVNHIDTTSLAEIAFARLFFKRLVKKDKRFCEDLLDSCRNKIDELLSGEPLWALVFSWLPVFAEINRNDLIQLAVGKLQRPPESIAEIYVLIEAYVIPQVRAYLNRRIQELTNWDPGLFVRLVEMVILLPDEDKRKTAGKLCSLLVHLPPNSFAQFLKQRNCFHEVTTLVAKYGEPMDRELAVMRIGDVLTLSLEEGRQINQTWLEAYLHLVNRAIAQDRSGQALEITKEAILAGNTTFPVESNYRACFNSYHRGILNPAIEYGIKLLEDAKANPRESFKNLPSNFLPLAASRAEESDWRRVAGKTLSLLEVIARSKVAFDRISAVILPVFSGIRRGPKEYQEKFLKILLALASRERDVETQETGKLTLKLLGFAALQSWLGADIRCFAKKTLLGLIMQPDQVYVVGNQFFQNLCGTLRSESFTVNLRLGMPDDWINTALVNTYMSQVGTIAWDEPDRSQLVRQLIHKWKGNQKFWQNLTVVLLCLKAPENAAEFAQELAREKPNYPDSYGLLAICKARMGDLTGVRANLEKVMDIHEKIGKGLHPHLAFWMHRELAAISDGIKKKLHLLCAELLHDRPLRPYEEVIADADRPLIPSSELEEPLEE